MAGINGRVQTQDVEGTVEAVNRTGLKIGGAWVNVSQYHPVELPEAGAHVRLKVDSKGFIRELDVVPTVLSQSPAVVSHERDERITRLAVLKASAHFLGLMSQCREEVRSEHVLILAEKWLAWVEGDKQGYV